MKEFGWQHDIVKMTEYWNLENLALNLSFLVAVTMRKSCPFPKSVFSSAEWILYMSHSSSF